MASDKQHYHEFSKFLQDCRDHVAASYTDRGMDQTLYNREAVEAVVARERQAAAREARIVALQQVADQWVPMLRGRTTKAQPAVPTSTIHAILKSLRRMQDQLDGGDGE